MDKQTIMEIKNLSKSFHHPIIKNLDLKVEKGDLILIQGTNGCGKSTLLKIICGLMKPDEGEITFCESNKIGALIENPHFIENETAIYNMKFLIELTSEFFLEKVQKYFEMFGLDVNDQTQVKKYSVGMRQKLGIIQAVMEDQTFIVFDEPTRGLDKESVLVFENLVHTLVQKEAKTCIICAHDGVQGIQFNRILEMKDGKLFEK